MLHECDFKGEIEEGMPDPDSRMSFGCGELYDACVRTQLLEPQYIDIGYRRVPAEWAKGTFEELIDHVRTESEWLKPAANITPEEVQLGIAELSNWHSYNMYRREGESRRVGC
ncbi:hypothetical protein ONZ51_g1703 [Trametes cubensis]|uniref:Uncharacterized protein n=1 Tax=Trametes cubensis TaxID=1111947 RepID=A0AAD7XEL4_9APHY|nr:hypothetical protein ONZ51_g1703 [Trametes cubensis]